jgi:non-specific serine/threonine protein kinase/serine/threonine-protein kinase
MSPETWRRVKDVFDAAAEIKPSHREEFLAQTCGGHPELIDEVRSLLASLEDAGDFIESSPALPESVAGNDAEPAFRTGTNIGPYRIVQVIGEGGMGMVYQAVRVDDLYRKLVALKVVRRGLYSRDAMRRFETERGILAHLDHPNIARLLDGGTTPDGQPWFVMDFIAGTPIDEHCERAQLPIDERLRLFLTVCSAVQYAHRNFVVHRDIKPRNILVTAEGDIRLLDFGIAKLLDPDAESPAETTSVQMMTPEYASPEQLFGQPVTTASDTYSLGVLLYLLLTGQKPFVFKTRSPQEIAAAIRDSDPRKPSSVVAGRLVKELAGDLDNILLKALRREPERRYLSAEAMANDIERYRSGLPVLARDGNFRYRAGKFVRRHQGAVVAACIAVLALIAGTITTSWEAHAARVERERAERRFNDVRRVANSLLFDVQDAIRDLPDAAPARDLIVAKATEFLDNLAPDASNDPALERELGSSYERLGDVEAQQALPAARLSYRKALAIREAASAQAPADLDLRRELIANCAKLSDSLWRDGDHAGALVYSRKGLQLSGTLGTARQDRIQLAANHLDYGYKLALSKTDRAAGMEECRKAIALFAQMAQEDPSNPQLVRLRKIAEDRLAEVAARS